MCRLYRNYYLVRKLYLGNSVYVRVRIACFGVVKIAFGF